jgi:hypothetical protein
LKTETVKAESFEVLVDKNDINVIGLQVNPSGRGRRPFVIPMARSTATDVGLLLLLAK